VLPPYGTDELAQAVCARLRSCGITALSVSVTADDIAKTWRVAARLENGREVVTIYPYSAPEGIHTPRELAEWFARDAGTDTT
jgi:hypothetical protein